MKKKENPAMLKQQLNKWVEDLKNLNGDNLISVIRYNENHLMILLNEINFYNLLDNSPIAKKMHSRGTIPLYLTEEYIKTSCDIYPLEYMKMKKNYNLIYGKDVLQSLIIPAENIRLESEQKIKGALIRLTQVILEEGDKRKKLIATARLAIEDLTAGLEGMLKIKGLTIPADTSLLQEAEKQFNIDLHPFKEVATWCNKTRNKNIKKTLYDFYEKIEELAKIVDQIKIPEQ